MELYIFIQCFVFNIEKLHTLEKELIIHSTAKEIHIALLEDKKLVEIHQEEAKNNLNVGDIFLGRISKLLPGLNAAFVDIGFPEKDAFLHYTDLGPKLRSILKFTQGAITAGIPSHLLKDFKIEADISKKGKIGEVLAKGQYVLVQILKEPISTKGPRLCCEITIPGRYVVLTPFSDAVAVSKKIQSEEERLRLKNLIESIRPHNFGFIVRTAAEGATLAELHEDINNLVEKWKQIHEQLHNAKAPMKCLSELNKTKSILRDFWNESFTNIVVDDKDIYTEVVSELQKIAPNQTNTVRLHNASARPIFDQYGVTRQIKASFGKTATMSSGAYIVIEHTEAMHVIDVNSGHKMSSTDQEHNAMRVNLEAAEEIARQLRLRDIGGIIIIDFIDMKTPENRLKLYQEMKRFMENDKAKHTILPLSKFGLMQITRERVRPQINITTAEVCPSCNGTGKINATILLTDDINRDLDFIMKSQRPKKLTLMVHPYIYAYLRRGFFWQQISWWREYRRWVRIKADNNYPLVMYKFFDETNEEIRLN